MYLSHFPTSHFPIVPKYSQHDKIGVLNVNDENVVRDFIYIRDIVVDLKVFLR